jgi:hypothetical protein
MAKFSGAKVVGVGLIFAIISQIIHTLFAFIEIPYYVMDKYMAVWSPIMMGTGGAPPSEFYIVSIGFAWIIGMLFVIVYDVIKKGIPGSKGWHKGLFYGFMIFLVGTVPALLMTLLLINIPVVLFWLWMLSGLIVNLLGGILAGWLMKS